MPIVAAVNRRNDTIIRIALLTLAVAALVVMFLVADDASLDRSARFWRLALLGTFASAIGPATDIRMPYVDRVPLFVRHGRPPRPAGPVVARPEPIPPTSNPVAIGLRPGPTFGALAGSAAVAFVAGSLGYALARNTNSDGGLLLYAVFGAACLLGLRSVFRLLTSRRALTFDTDRIRLGWCLGYVPSRTIWRRAVSTIEVGSESPRKIALVDEQGRRFEIRPDHLTQPELVGFIAAAWPEVEWRELPEIKEKL